MRELDKELKELRLYGMAGAWEDMIKQGGHAAQRREAACMGVKRHLVALAGVGHQPERPAGAQLHV